MPLEIDVLTLFPPMVEGPLGQSIPARILERGLATVRVHDLREWGIGRHRTVDDYTYGGGAGMVLRPEPVAAALAALRRPDSIVILLDPAGEVFRQPMAHELAEASHLVFLCPRYEGVDERIRAMVDRELSIGDYVLTGGRCPRSSSPGTTSRSAAGGSASRCAGPWSDDPSCSTGARSRRTRPRR